MFSETDDEIRNFMFVIKSSERRSFIDDNDFNIFSRSAGKEINWKETINLIKKSFSTTNNKIMKKSSKNYGRLILKDDKKKIPTDSIYRYLAEFRQALK